MRVPNNPASPTPAPAASVTSAASKQSSLGAPGKPGPVSSGACWLQPPEEAPLRPGPRPLSVNQETGSPCVSRLQASPQASPLVCLPLKQPQVAPWPQALSRLQRIRASGSARRRPAPGTLGRSPAPRPQWPSARQSAHRNACRPRGPVPLAWTRWRPPQVPAIPQSWGPGFTAVPAAPAAPSISGHRPKRFTVPGKLMGSN
ncbi:translation initiation factor IF-2-like [Camelus ferus]|uniref:Translation initiation factor IF-2-like n=1 Tax=Camelus ferus TaxID=419612 RepID=A0A8B8SFG8_CAMFR|nr:translation initiation factor IF-2-like [Camelus ferus]XP_032328534.1 translation initiation factor IF-2-like [Camelus ferus]